MEVLGVSSSNTLSPADPFTPNRYSSTRKIRFTDLHRINDITDRDFGWQGIHLRVVGVCDSNSLLVASDVFTMELGDSSLLQVCRIKSDGSSLLTLGGTGNFPMAMMNLFYV